MNADFVKLVEAEYQKIQNTENGESCFYIGEGDPDADILIIGNECAIGDDDSKLSELSDKCSEDKRRKTKERIIAEDNVKRWKELLKKGYDVEDIKRELQDYNGRPDNDKYYPLCPWFGQKNIVRITDKDGNAKRGAEGTSRTWVQYQKLLDWIDKEEFIHNKFIDFHLKAFHTELSQIPRKHSGAKNKETADSIQKRLDYLFINPFFKKFPIVIIAAGHYVRDYKIDIDSRFDVKVDINLSVPTKKGRLQWINIHRDSPRRILLHTMHLAASITNDYIKEIAKQVLKKDE